MAHKAAWARTKMASFLLLPNLGNLAKFTKIPRVPPWKMDFAKFSSPISLKFSGSIVRTDMTDCAKLHHNVTKTRGVVR